MLINLHTHTPWCDGRSTLDEMVIGAIERGLSVLGFSPHAPVGFKTDWSILDLDQTYAYCSEFLKLKEKYIDEIKIISGLEADYIPDRTYDFNMLREKFGFQYIIGSIHMVKRGHDLWFIDGPRDGYLEGLRRIFNNDIKKAAEAFYNQSVQMVRMQNPDIIGHLDKIVMHNNYDFFNPEEDWHLELLDSLLYEVKQSKCMVEINTRGLYTGKYNDFYPGAYLFKRLKDLQIPVLINSDAHHVDDLTAHYKQALTKLVAIGIEKLHYPIGKCIQEVECQRLRTML